MKVTTEVLSETVGDEAGTVPGDRKFRPDVQGLRAVAILLVVLYHANIPGVSGGYIGVDVFFVISGFVITGVLLREHESTGKTSILSFYGRRARRIIPAASLVIVVTVLASFPELGSVAGRATAVDGQWASVFLANFHFAASETNYLASQRPPSSLQNYWSLAVEEQFYLVYPTIFLILARIFVRSSLRARIGVVLGAVVIGSYIWSITLTSSNASSAFFSPFTRAWELALGGLVAIFSANLRRLPGWIAAAFSWIGLGGILVAAFVYTSASSYPGSLVAIPVLGAGLIIAAGAAQPKWGVESILRRWPFQSIGLISYSLYLWHWPILIIATQSRGVSGLPVADNLLLLLVAFGAAIGTYLVVENPTRHSRFLIGRRWASVVMGICLIGSSLGVTTIAVRNTKQALTGGLAAATSGSPCHPPYKTELAAVRSAYRSGQLPKVQYQVTHKIRMVVVGDSTACTMVGGLAAVGSSYGVHVVDGTVIGCGIVSGRIAPYYYGPDDLEASTKECQSDATQAESKALGRGKPNIIVWGSTDERKSIVVDTPTGSKVFVKGTSEWKKVMLQRIEGRVGKFLATGAKVVLLTQPPFVNSGNPTQPTPSDVDFERLNGLLREVAAAHPDRVALVDLASYVCPSGPPCPYVVDGIGEGEVADYTVRPDASHYGIIGSIWVADWLVPQILSAVSSHS